MADSTWVYAVMGGVSADEPRPHFHCERCGAREAQNLPASVTNFVAQSRRFIDAHRGCTLPESGGDAP